jgi:hypothetical protein
MARAAGATVAVLAAVFVIATGLAEQRPRVRVATDYPKIGRAGLDPVLASLRELPPGRMQVRAGAENHWAVMLPYIYTGHPAFLAMGGAGLQSSANYVFTWELRDRDPRRAAWIFDAPYVIARADRTRELAGAELITASADYALLRYPAPGLVGPVLVAGELPRDRDAERRAGVGWLWSPLPYAGVVLAEPGTGAVGATPHGRVTRAARDGSSILADVEVDAAIATPTTFVVRETWHPRWRATIDGAPAPIRRVTPAFMAIDVPPGAHAIALQFERPQWALLLWLVWPALPLLAAFGEWIAMVLQRRRAASA